MTSIMQFTTAEWKKRLESRKSPRLTRKGRNGADIVIFPGVRVEYHSSDNGQISDAKSDRRRLELRPAVHTSPAE